MFAWKHERNAVWLVWPPQLLFVGYRLSCYLKGQKAWPGTRGLVSLVLQQTVICGFHRVPFKDPRQVIIDHQTRQTGKYQQFPYNGSHFSRSCTKGKHIQQLYIPCYTRQSQTEGEKERKGEEGGWGGWVTKCHHSGTHSEQYKKALVSLAHTIIHPGTVVIHLADASLTNAAERRITGIRDTVRHHHHEHFLRGCEQVIRILCDRLHDVGMCISGRQDNVIQSLWEIMTTCKGKESITLSCNNKHSTWSELGLATYIAKNRHCYNQNSGH